MKKVKNRVIVWRLTQQCNLLCGFCSYSREVERRRDEADALEIERVSEVLGEYMRLTGDNILVSWIGGEPFLRKDIFVLSKYLNSHGIEISATTNGIPLDKKCYQISIVTFLRLYSAWMDSKCTAMQYVNLTDISEQSPKRSAYSTK